MKRKGRSLALLTGAALVVMVGVLAWVNREHIRFFLEFESLGVNAQGYPEFRHRQAGIVLVRLPGGEFWMGAQKENPNGRNYDPDAQESEGPVHKVVLSPFLIAKLELNQAEWNRVMKSRPSEFKGENLPVEQVSWEDCQEFCKKTGLSLPSEAQWEYACRADTTGPYAGTGELGEMGWYMRNSGRTTHPVGEKRPNQFGLYDTHGNVWEWCQDVWDPEFYKKPEASQKNPVSTSGSVGRVIRGGCWDVAAGGCRSAFRFRYHPSSRYFILGFRPAWSSP